MTLLAKTAYTSFGIQVLTGGIDVWALRLNIPEEFNILRDVLILELIVQLIEGVFYMWLLYALTTGQKNVTQKRYWDWFLTTPMMLFSLMAYMHFLRLQERGETITLREFLDEIAQKGLLAKRLTNIGTDQHGILSATEALVTRLGSLNKNAKAGKSTRLSDELKGLATGPMDVAVKLLDGPKQLAKSRTAVSAVLENEQRVQTEIIHRLTALLGSIAQREEEKTEQETELQDDDDAQRLRDDLTDAKDKLKEFMR